MNIVYKDPKTLKPYRYNNNGHPSTFPVELPLSYIKACTDTNGSVFDPFGGSGSTLIACEKANRICYMMELDEHYCDVIIQRWEEFTQKQSLKINA